MIFGVIQVRWVRLGIDSTGKEGVTDISTGTSIKDNTKYSIDKPTTLTWRLRIKNVRESDEAHYRCYVQTTMTNKKESRMALVVRSESSFILYLRNKLELAGYYCVIFIHLSTISVQFQ